MMRTSLLGTALACGLFVAAAPAFAQGACSRADLQKIADGYVAAQTEGNAFKIPLTQWVQYSENMDSSASLGGGMLSKPLKVDYSRSLLDTQICQTFTEAVIADSAHPYVVGTFLSSRGGEVNAIDTIITDEGDWLFNAANTLKYAQAEKWTPIPEGERDTRATILAAANAYLDSFNDKTIQVPWGTPCARLEGGMYTGKGGPDDSCNVGVPSGVKITDRRYVVDESLGAVAVLSLFGANKRPDIHTFRIEKGKIRYVHTLTVCDKPNCGLPAPAAAK